MFISLEAMRSYLVVCLLVCTVAIIMTQHTSASEPAKPEQRTHFYKSSIDGTVLATEVLVPAKPLEVLVYMHGFAQGMSHARERVLESTDFFADYLVVMPDMRGRSSSSGKADLNGFELQDVIDAVEFVKRKYADRIVHPERVYLGGHSGGGGNVLALLGKFPTYFTAAWAACAISDYAAWYAGESEDYHRDSMRSWTKSTPIENIAAYQARSGISLLPNVHTPLMLLHGSADAVVSVEQSRKYYSEALELQKGHLVQYIELPGEGHATLLTPEVKQQLRTFLTEAAQPPMLPSNGSLVVGGYITTNAFQVRLPSLDNVATVHYDLESKTIDGTPPGSLVKWF